MMIGHVPAQWPESAHASGYYLVSDSSVEWRDTRMRAHAYMAAGQALHRNARQRATTTSRKADLKPRGDTASERL
jgi:hypothetical protein